MDLEIKKYKDYRIRKYKNKHSIFTMFVFERICVESSQAPAKT